MRRQAKKEKQRINYTHYLLATQECIEMVEIPTAEVGDSQLQLKNWLSVKNGYPLEDFENPLNFLND